MFRLRIEIFHNDRQVDHFEVQHENKFSVVLKAALKWLNELGPY
jgi:hypothetical protein